MPLPFSMNPSRAVREKVGSMLVIGAKAWAKLGLTPISSGLKDTLQPWVLGVSSGLSLSIKHLDQALLSNRIIITTPKHREHCYLGFVKREDEPAKVYVTYLRSRSRSAALIPWRPETSSLMLCFSRANIHEAGSVCVSHVFVRACVAGA